MDALLAYVPDDRANALAHGGDLPHMADGAALFADISGFTPLTEALSHALGPRIGAEVLTDQLNRVYSLLTKAVAQWRGTIISFSGDAITCWFDQVDGNAALRAAACALDLQQAMTPFAQVALPGGRAAALTLKVSVATGAAHRYLVGDPAIQLIDILAGATLARMAAGEHHATAGEILLDSATVAAIAPYAILGAERVDHESEQVFTLLQALNQRPQVAAWEAVDLPAATLRQWVLPVVWEQASANLGAFLTELRPAVALFLRFSSPDVDHDPTAGAQLDTLIRQVQQVIVESGGTLLQITIGDKGSYLYAVFGAPIAHEDDAERAARAALKLHRLVAALNLPAVQIGISQGTMRCGAYGGPQRKTYGVLGDDVNLAARLMGRAEPGETLLSGRVYQELEADFIFQPRSPIQLKGKAEPLPVFALTGVSQRRAMRLQEPTYDLPMIGREAELATIQRCLERAIQGQGQVVCIQAEAGMGKSRLVAEAIRLARRLESVGYGGSAASSGTNRPYLVWQPIIQALLDLDRDAPLRRLMRQLVGELEDCVPERVDSLPLLDLLLELDLPENDFTKTLTPQDRKHVREALLVDLLIYTAKEAGSEGGALLLVLEDTHWIDPLSSDLLLRVAQAAANLPLLLLIATRPTNPPDLSAITRIPYTTTITLAGLDDIALAGLVRTKLAQLFPARLATLPTGLVELLASRAQGNPFYIEELLNYLRDRGISPDTPLNQMALELPDSLYRLVLARIDQLSERERTTLRVASVVGRLFRAAWLQIMAPDLGDLPRIQLDLERLALVDLTPLDTPAPELTYLFKHVVTQEVAYTSLPQATRLQLHAILASWLEQTMPEHPPLDLLAYHYDQSENLPKRRFYLRKAGEAAASQYANTAAIDYLSRAITLAAEDPTEQWELLLVREAVYDLLGQREDQATDLALLAELAAGNHAYSAELTLRQSQYYEKIGDFHTAEEAAEQSLLYATGNPGSEALARIQAGTALRRQSNFVAARAKVAPALSWAQANTEPLIERDALMAYAMASLDDLPSAQQHLTVALQISHRLADWRNEGRILNNLGYISRNLGYYIEAERYYRQALPIFQRIGDRMGAAICQLNIAAIAVLIGDYAHAQPAAEEALRLTQAIEAHQAEAIILHMLGDLAYNQGDFTTAYHWLNQSLSLIRTTGDRDYEEICLLSIGYLLIALGQLDQALAIFEELHPLASSMGDQLLSLAGLAAVYRAKADLTQAIAQIEPIIATLPDTDLQGNEYDLHAYYQIYLVLYVANDPKAPRLLKQLYIWLLKQTETMDQATKDMFLGNVPTNRAIMAEYRVYGQD